MSDINMTGFPNGLEDWLRKQDGPFTIFFNAAKEIVFVWGEGPWDAYQKRKINSAPELPGLLNLDVYMHHPEEKG